MACTHCLSEPSLLFAKMSQAHETNNEQIPFPEMHVHYMLVRA